MLRWATELYIGSRSLISARNLASGSSVCSSGRLASKATRRSCSLMSTCSNITQPRDIRFWRFDSRSMDPPPVASTMLGRDVSSSMMRSSLSRKPCSPSYSKIVGMSTPQRSSIFRSLSMKVKLILRANALPTVLFPDPIGPIRKMLVMIRAVAGFGHMIPDRTFAGK